MAMGWPVYRTSDKSIGVPWAQVPSAIHNLLSNVKYHIDHQTYPLDEIAARLHHKLVEIHPFANGNGRHARYITDTLLKSMGSNPFSWGKSKDPRGIDRTGETRQIYIESLKRADKKDMTPLLQFVRS
jgi:Fic-DOC domain mobile mystery protein B